MCPAKRLPVRLFLLARTYNSLRFGRAELEGPVAAALWTSVLPPAFDATFQRERRCDEPHALLGPLRSSVAVSVGMACERMRIDGDAKVLQHLGEGRESVFTVERCEQAYNDILSRHLKDQAWPQFGPQTSRSLRASRTPCYGGSEYPSWIISGVFGQNAGLEQPIDRRGYVFTSCPNVARTIHGGMRVGYVGAVIRSSTSCAGVYASGGHACQWTSSWGDASD